MSQISELDRLVQEAIRLTNDKNNQKLLAGPIIPAWLRPALPVMGKSKPASSRRSQLDTIALLVLGEIVGAYRAKGSKTWWRGPAYQLDRRQSAMQYGTTPEDVSRAVTFLEGADIVWVKRQARKNADGDYAGNSVFVVPNMRK